MILGNDLHSTTYTVKEIEVVNGRTKLSFGDVLYIVGMGAVALTNAETATVTSDRNLTGYGGVDGGMHAGCWLYNEDKSRGFRIAAIGGKEFTLEGAEGDLEEVFADASGDGRRLYWISDIGPGDTYRIPTATHFAR